MYQLGRDIEDEFSTLEDVSEALKTISKIPGRAFGGGKAKCLPPVIGLQIEGVGEVPLPLSEHDIARVTAVVDPCAENIQLEPSQFTIKNPKWNKTFETLVAQAATDLGASPANVTAKISKLLLYPPGKNYCNIHRNKEETMIGFLVVQLPSCFVGGCFVVNHWGEERVYLGGGGGGEKGRRGEGAYECFYFCHFVECEHDMEVVESGHRLVLIYSLHHSPSHAPPSLPPSKPFSDLEWSLSCLPPSKTLFVYFPQNEYPFSSLSSLGVKGLKGVDTRIKQVISQAGRRAGEGEEWEMVFFRVERDQEVESKNGELEPIKSLLVDYDLVRGKREGMEEGREEEGLKWIGNLLTLGVKWGEEGPVGKGVEGRVVGGEGFSWGKGPQSVFQVSGKRLAVVKYWKNAFIFFKSKNKDQICCDFHFGLMISDAQSIPTLLPSLLSYLQTTPTAHLTAQQFITLASLALPPFPPYPSLVSPPNPPPPPSPYYGLLLGKVEPTGGELSLSSKGIGAVLLYFCCFCGDSMKKGVESLVKWVVERSVNGVRESVFLQGEFLLALERGCSFYTSDMCKGDIDFLLERMEAGDGGGVGKTTEELERFVRDYVGTEGLVYFVSGYVEKLLRGYNEKVKAFNPSSSSYLKHDKLNQTLKHITQIISVLFASHPSPPVSLRTLLSNQTNALITNLTSLINNIHLLPNINISPFFWAFPNAVHSHPEICRILRSNESEGRVKLGMGIGHARVYEKRAEERGDVILREGFSAEIRAFGSGANASVAITKNTRYRDILQREKLKRETVLKQAQQKLDHYTQMKRQLSLTQTLPPNPTPTFSPSPNSPRTFTSTFAQQTPTSTSTSTPISTPTLNSPPIFTSTPTSTSTFTSTFAPQTPTPGSTNTFSTIALQIPTSTSTSTSTPSSTRTTPTSTPISSPAWRGMKGEEWGVKGEGGKRGFDGPQPQEKRRRVEEPIYVDLTVYRDMK